MDYIDYIGDRIAKLRVMKGVSARDMSLSLGQSDGYINKIENKRILPSVHGLMYICEYFGITPSEFFDETIAAPVKVREILTEVEQLSPEQIDHLLLLIRDLKR